MSVAVISPNPNTCQNCKHWGRGFNASTELQDLDTYIANSNPLKLVQLKKALTAYPLRREDKCQKKENEKTEKHMVYVGIFTTRTEVFQRPTTKDWYCPLWEKLEVIPEIKLTFNEWFALKAPADKKVYDITVEGCKLAGNTYFINSRKERLKNSSWSWDKINEETFDKILSHCTLKNKSWF